MRQTCDGCTGNGGLNGDDSAVMRDTRLREAPRAELVALLRGLGLGWDRHGDHQLAGEYRRAADELEAGVGAVMLADVTYVVVEAGVTENGQAPLQG